MAFCLSAPCVADAFIIDGGITVDIPPGPAGNPWTLTEDLEINGNATMNISANGEVSNINGYIARNVGDVGTVTVAGTGSTWENIESLYIGVNGTGSLTISDGGKVTSTYGDIGVHGNSSGTVTVEGSGAAWDITGHL